MAKKRYYAGHTGFLKDGHGYGPEYYAGEDPRRLLEARDSGMISADRSAMANMPQAAIMKYWPEELGYMPENLDDTIKGVQEQIGADNSQKMKHLKPRKY